MHVYINTYWRHRHLVQSACLKIKLNLQKVFECSRSKKKFRLVQVTCQDMDEFS